MRLNKEFINSDLQDQILAADIEKYEKSVGNADYSWYFQDFGKVTGSNPPKPKDQTNARKWLCQKPDTASADRNYFKHNLSGPPSEIERRCPKRKIELRNTQSYIKELLEEYASQLEIKEFVEIIKTLE